MVCNKKTQQNVSLVLKQSEKQEETKRKQRDGMIFFKPELYFTVKMNSWIL